MEHERAKVIEGTKHENREDRAAAAFVRTRHETERKNTKCDGVRPFTNSSGPITAGSFAFFAIPRLSRSRDLNLDSI